VSCKTKAVPRTNLERIATQLSSAWSVVSNIQHLTRGLQTSKVDRIGHSKGKIVRWANLALDSSKDASNLGRIVTPLNSVCWKGSFV
jgi:hypothetical protein